MKFHFQIIFLALVFFVGVVWAEEGIKKEESAKKAEASTYSPVGKRDPFRLPPVSSSRDVAAIGPLERFALEQFQLRGILKGLGQSKAMFQDPDGKTHILVEGDLIGRGRATISRILNKGVVVTERTFNYLGQESLYEKLLTLPEDTEKDKPLEAVNGVVGRQGGTGEAEGQIPQAVVPALQNMDAPSPK